MKKIALIGLVALVFAACHKMERGHEDTPCPVVSTESVPKNVKEAFTTKYPGAIVSTWFNKDNNGFTAMFTQNGNETYAQFNNDGAFINEDNYDNQQREHHGNKHDNEDDEGCSCDTEDAD